MKTSGNRKPYNQPPPQPIENKNPFHNVSYPNENFHILKPENQLIEP